MNDQLASNQTGNATPALASCPRRPRSKIARLPSEIRYLINHSLLEGMSDLEVVFRLCALGHDGITRRNVSTWARTGYREWLREQNQLQNSLAQTAAALTQLGRPDRPDAPDLPRLIDTFLATLLQQLFQDFDPASLKTLLAEKPAEFFRLLATLNGHIAARASDKRAEVDRARCQVEVSEKAQAGRDEPPDAKLLWQGQRIVEAINRQQDPVALAMQKLDHLRHRHIRPSPPRKRLEKRPNPNPAHHPPKTDPPNTETDPI